MKHLIILTFIIVFIFFGHNLGYDANSPWWTHITYNFQHANIMHLLLNSVSFFYIFRALEQAIKPRSRWRKFATCALLPLLIATIASFFTPYPPQWLTTPLSPWWGEPEGGLGRVGEGLPVVGASGIIYAMLGMYFALIATKRIRFKDVTALIVLITSVSIFLIISLFKENSAGMLHLLCLILGFSVQAISNRLKKLH